MRMFRVAACCVLTLTSTAALAAEKGSRWVVHPTQPFEILSTEATVADFQACVKAGKCDAAAVDSQCNVSDPAKAQHPVNCINHGGATALCEHLGGRLCSSTEWLAACRGGEDRAFPYGAAFEPAACQTGSYEHAAAGGRGTVPAGSMKDCQGGIPGLFDMSGNVSEWVSDCNGTYCKFRGAAYAGNEPVEYFAGCGDVCSGNENTLQSGTVGVRCCRDRAGDKAAGQAARKTAEKK
ncbi:MAG TPA: SUMF1/EgtB/PvdO family nonheme iron enzyme [Candidatus Limnocylindrales bacterium]|nr:SUMF1/EgtB/PvdO family nonheme iron enzyme [Candidatus Limnocylindrales bacterium]